ncbi:MAG TPA: NYN domain-containing protein [Candidatus Saccharimonadales bacterium]|nr:NYN domain-containing protein [Candidatus Saccharimonadales bacterium]
MTPKNKKPNTYAFIDSQNLNLGTQRMGWKLDWRKFRQFLADKYGVTHAYMFIGYMSDNESLYEYMHELGFLVVLKPTIDVSPKPQAEAAPPREGSPPKKDGDDKEKPIIKGNVDAELVLYAMKELPNYSQAIIVSGDGDFFSLAEYLEEQGKLANILTPNWQYSSLLKPFEAKIVRLDQLRRQLSYHDRKKKKKSNPAS